MQPHPIPPPDSVPPPPSVRPAVGAAIDRCSR
jgi:hypothetical protein